MLVIDEDIDKRVATELKGRGRLAVAVSELQLRGMKDEPLLRALAAHFHLQSTWVLVTGDDAMPDDHGETLAQLSVTLATIDPRRRHGSREMEWRKDVVHRWAHAMVAQEPGSIRRYSVGRHGVWRPRRSGRRR
jgi:hypothetical protein